ncbi:hypothetical protein Srubr_19750 [Streptomyces rubradiris]|uniref:Uncharacterized protein n=1 Tax=Streptomyces rubradiris TaxID=285531 RepID=A0ABQ3R8G2_STRRR|nr:hypothetical protein GCM10018792_59490 [Streptomyces rubradiris]GHI52129.1 hypothetical protein Srubr_19750 [Streptomyces rubradiris]
MKRCGWAALTYFIAVSGAIPKTHQVDGVGSLVCFGEDPVDPQLLALGSKLSEDRLDVAFGDRWSLWVEGGDLRDEQMWVGAVGPALVAFAEPVGEKLQG